MVDSRIGMTKEILGELEDKMIKIMQSEGQKENTQKKNKDLSNL